PGSASLPGSVANRGWRVPGELPVELQRELNRAWADGCRERAAEQRALHRSVRIGEIRMVEGVEHLGAELEAILLLEQKILEYAKVGGVHGIPPQHVLFGAAKARRLGCVQSRVQGPVKGASIPSRRVQAAAAQERIAQCIRTAEVCR